MITLIKAGGLHSWLLLMSLTFLTLGLLCARPAQAQGGWNVTDQAGSPLTSSPDGSGYYLQGPRTGSLAPTGS